MSETRAQVHGGLAGGLLAHLKTTASRQRRDLDGTGRDHVYVVDPAAQNPEPVSKDAKDVSVLCVRGALPGG